jgi:hypothetical protein
VVIRRPTVTPPSALDEIVLRGLVVDRAKADVALRRSNRRVVVFVLDKDGSVRVIINN